MSMATYRREGRVGIITVDNPPVNAMSHGVRLGIVEGLNAAEADGEAQAVVLICAGNTFIAGADIKEFNAPMQEPFHDEVIERLENCPKPVIAAIHGTALGGGLETALGCHYRVAVPSAKCGLPEVNLGIIPGAGGTQRLPRLIGVEAAARIAATGEPIGAQEAHALGLVDAIVEGDLLAGAVGFAERCIAEGRGPRRVRDMQEKLAGATPELFARLRAEIAKAKKGLDAPQRALDAVEAATQLPFQEGLSKEKEIFFACLLSPQSMAMRHLFAAERRASKIPDVPADTPTRPIRSAAVVGAGTMGGGIAMNFANAGIPCVVLEMDQAALERGLGVVRRNYESTLKKGKLTQEQFDKRMGLLKPTLNYDDLKDTDIVIEAVFEDMAIKKEVFSRLDAVCRPGCILATNTSTLDVNEIAAATRRPEDVIGLHFFSPANIMKLLEIVRGAKTGKEVIATSFALAKTIKKVGVLVGVCDGFVGNRMVHPYVREALFLLEEGALPQQVDAAMTDFGFAMGPFAMSDLAGLDIGWRIRQRQAATRPKDERYAEIGDIVCEKGRYGQKTGAGWYRYEAGNRTPLPDPEVEQLIVEESRRKGITRREISNQEIVDRLVYALINEGARILEEGIALRASDIDVIYVYGYGFPPYRGGPMYYADAVGATTVYERVKEFHAQHGKLWEPAPLLERLAKEGGRFADFGR